jgi:hypothetical protein
LAAFPRSGQNPNLASQELGDTSVSLSENGFDLLKLEWSFRVMVGNWIRRVLEYGMVDLNMSPRFRMVKIQESLQELGQNGSRILIGQNLGVFNDGFRIGLKVTKNSIFTLDSPFESAFLKNFVNFKKIELKNINISLFRGCLEVCHFSRSLCHYL